MGKCLEKFRKFYKNYIFIFASVTLLYLYYCFFGYTFDEEPDYKIQIFNNGIYRNHYLIHQIFIYLSCAVLSLFFLGIEKCRTIIREDKNVSETSSGKENATSFEENSKIVQIYTKEFNPKYSKINIIIIIFLYIILEQIKIIYDKYFLHFDFWMFHLYMLAYLNFKMFNIDIYKHQKLAFFINSFSIIFNVVVIILTVIEGNEDKAIYSQYLWTLSIAIAINIIHSVLLSYCFIKIKSFMDLKFISINVILLIYGIIGFLFCSIFCTVTTFWKIDNNKVGFYLFKVMDNNNQSYIDNFIVYFNDNNQNKTNANDLKFEIVDCTLGSFLFGFYKYFSFQIFENLTPIHKAFSYPILFFSEKIIFLLVNVKNFYEKKNDYYLMIKLILDLFSDFFSIIGYIIYLEIIELNFCGFNYNLRKNIIIRGRYDSNHLDTYSSLFEEEGEESSENEKSKSDSSITELY